MASNTEPRNLLRKEPGMAQVSLNVTSPRRSYIELLQCTYSVMTYLFSNEAKRARSLKEYLGARMPGIICSNDHSLPLVASVYTQDLAQASSSGCQQLTQCSWISYLCWASSCVMRDQLPLLLYSPLHDESVGDSGGHSQFHHTVILSL